METIRTCVFRPYQYGGPVFTLRLAGPVSREGRERLSYTLHMSGKVLFQGDDFGVSPLHSIDGDEAVKALMGFLTLRPGDTDREYFDGYTEDQRRYCEEHAEALACEVDRRFPEVAA